MKETIFGTVLGAGLVALGFSYHDINHGETFFEQDGIKVSPNTYVMGWPLQDRQEWLAWTIGMTGTAILTSSLKDAWDRSRPPKSKPSRLRKVLDLTVGIGCLYASAQLHDTTWRRDSNRWYLSSYQPHPDYNRYEIAQRAENAGEHLGYLLGVVGSAWTTISVKEAFGSRYNLEFRLMVE
ncbi:MAG: hypothetical protein OXU79_08930 [Gemmatimonadota bacterium]|nr:hypothetical protein [Gemmatimonadota bacterium]